MARREKLAHLQQKCQFFALPLYFCILVCLDLAFRYLYHTGTYTWTDLTPALFTLAWAAIFTGIAALLPGKAGKIWIIATCVFFSILTLVHAVMFNMFGAFFSLQDLVYAGDGAKFFSFTYLKIRKALILSVIFAIAGSLISAWLLPKKINVRKRLFALAPVVAGVVLAVVMHNTMITELVINNVMTWDVAINKVEEHPEKVIYTEFTNANGSLTLTGIYHYTIRNAAVTLSPAKADEKEAIKALDAWIEEQTPETSELAGTLEGKNLIMVMLESIDTFLLTEEYMPNLYAVQQQSANFTNNYTPLYLTAGTFGTEFLSVTGLIPPQNGADTDVYMENAFPYSLPNLFKKEGYTVNSFHSAGAAIYNRGAIHENLGFEAYHSYTNMGMDDYMLDSQLIRGFDQMVSDQPFYSFIITYSGHGPYDDSMSNISGPHLEAAQAAVAASGVTGSEANMQEYTLAVAHAMETDAFIGELMAALQESGHADDTVLVFYADHYCKYMTDVEFLMNLKNASNRNLLCNTPFFIYSSALEAQTIDTLASSVDIYPTICSLFHLDVDLSYFMGNDAFTGGDGYVYWRDYSWYDGTRYVDGSTTPEDAEGTLRSAEVRTKLTLAWNTIIYDYFGKR